MGLERNIVMGWLAVNAVRKIGIRANNLRDVNSMPEREYWQLTRCIDGVRAQADTLDRLAELAKQNHCGNCTEQDAVAIQFLNQYHVRPLDLMNLYPNNGVDHTFIVIGRIPNLVDPAGTVHPQCRSEGSTDSDPSTWGSDAVICDPWHDLGKVYPATEIQTKMFRGYGGRYYAGTLQPTSILRHN